MRAKPREWQRRRSSQHNGHQERNIAAKEVQIVMRDSPDFYDSEMELAGFYDSRMEYPRQVYFF
jgi:hypothetical protein